LTCMTKCHCAWFYCDNF